MPAKNNQELFSSKEYESTLADLKKHIRECQLKAVKAANAELIKLYWMIGKTIVEKQEKSGWGTKLIEKLAKDIQNEFPGIEGFSRTNIFRMRAFYLAHCNNPTAVGQLEEYPLEFFLNIPWGHNCVLFEKFQNFEERLWYAQKTIEHGWSRSMLETWIKSDLYHREGKAVTNFKNTLPSPESDMAQQALKDPFLFDFLTLHENHLEKDLEIDAMCDFFPFGHGPGLGPGLERKKVAHGVNWLGRTYPKISLRARAWICFYGKSISNRR